MKAGETERKSRDERKRRKRGKERKERMSGRSKTRRKEKKKNPFQPLFQSLLHLYSLCLLACVRTAKERPATSKAASEALIDNVFCFPFYGEMSEQI